MCFELGSPCSRRSGLNSYFYPQGEPRFLLMWSQDFCLGEHRTGGHSLLLVPLPEASKATGSCAHMASSSLCKTAFIFASSPGSGGATNKITFCFTWGWGGSGLQGQVGRAHPCSCPLFCLLVGVSGLARQGDLSSESGPMFPSACAPTPVELMLPCVSRGRVSFPGEAQVGGRVLNMALPPGNVWSITKHTHKCIPVSQVSAPLTPTLGPEICQFRAIINPRPLPSVTPNDVDRSFSTEPLPMGMTLFQD